MRFTSAQLRLIQEMDERLRRLEREAERTGDLSDRSRFAQIKLRRDLFSSFLKPVNAYCLSVGGQSLLPEDEVALKRILFKDPVDAILRHNFGGGNQDYQVFDMVDSSNRSSGVCFVDRNNLVSQGGQVRMPLNLVRWALQSARLAPWHDGDFFDQSGKPWDGEIVQAREDRLSSLVLNVTPVEGYHLVIYHFGSVDSARDYFYNDYSGRAGRRKIATKKLKDGTIGISSSNPPDWPVNKSKGFPGKSALTAFKWAKGNLPGVSKVGVLKGPEMSLNRQFLFVK